MSFYKAAYKGRAVRAGSNLHTLLAKAVSGMPRQDLKRTFGHHGAAHLGAAIKNGWVTCTINITPAGSAVLNKANEEALDAGTPD